jgi:hypothetical protein
LNAVRLHSTTPRRIDPSVRLLLEAMGLDQTGAVWLKLHRPKDFKPELAECHINVLVQRTFRQGEPVCGWTIWQDKANEFVEVDLP